MMKHQIIINKSVIIAALISTSYESDNISFRFNTILTIFIPKFNIANPNAYALTPNRL